MNEIKKDGLVFTERINPITGEVLKTAEEVYKEWLDNKNKQIDNCSTKTTEEKLEELMSKTEEMDDMIAELMLQI